MTPDISVQNSRVNEEATCVAPDSVDISLLTCGPGQEVWSYYGHTALRIRGQGTWQRRGRQLGNVHFQARLLCAPLRIRTHRLSDRHLPDERLHRRIQHEGRWVRQQRLHLSRQEKLEDSDMPSTRMHKPENRTYRYNFFFDNCTTRARDMMTHQHRLPQHQLQRYGYALHLQGRNPQAERATTAGQDFGNDLLLGLPGRPSYHTRENGSSCQTI